MGVTLLKSRDIFPIPVGTFFEKEDEACYMVYAPLANLFYLSRKEEIERLEKQLSEEKELADPLLMKLLDRNAFKGMATEVSPDTFCTLHLLLNEKCNFGCRYCYSAKGRSTREMTEGQIETMLEYFLSSERKAVKDRTVMFMGGGEPTLSWRLLEHSVSYAERLAAENGINLHLSLTTNGSLLDESRFEYLKTHNFTVQVSFEVLPDVQNLQRGQYDVVAANVRKMTECGINNYIRATITEANVDRIPEMVEHCHVHFPKVTKLSCQQVVDSDYFKTTEIVHDFFKRYSDSFRKGETLAEEYGITLRSSSSHLLNYSKRERFCYNLVCLTPYGTLTTCPDVSSPVEPDYKDAVIAEIKDGALKFDRDAFDRVSYGNIHTIGKCRGCYAKWNCGSGCPSSRRVYRPEIFDAVCDHYRNMLCHSLMTEIARKYKASTGRNMYEALKSQL